MCHLRISPFCAVSIPTASCDVRRRQNPVPRTANERKGYRMSVIFIGSVCCQLSEGFPMSGATPADQARIEALEAELARERAAAAELRHRLACQEQRATWHEPITSTAVAGYRATYELAPIGIAHIAADGRWLRANPFLCDMLGFSEAELITRTWQQLTHPDDRERDLCHVDALLKGTALTYTFEKRYLRKDGEIVWGQLTVTLIRDEQQAPAYFISVVKDIGPQVHATQALQRSEARLKAVLESLNEGVLVFDQHGKLLEANAAAMALFDYTHPSEIIGTPEVLGQTFEVWTLDGDPLEPPDWPISRLYCGHAVMDVELAVRRRGTARRWIGSFSGSVVYSHTEGPPLLVLTVRDISRRKTAENAMRLSEARLRLAFENIPDAIAIYDTDLRIQVVNAAMLALADMPAREVIGRMDSEFPPHSIMTLWRTLLTSAQVTGVIQSEDMTYPADEDVRNLAVTCVPVQEGEGRVREVMVICHDYTERRRAQDQVRHAALHDPLTNLPNRALLFEYALHAFAAADRSQSQAAVAFIDLDRFKPINDLYGHDVGDALLRQVADRLQAALRPQDIVFRFGGDEFIALLPGMDPNSAVAALNACITLALAKPFLIDSLSVQLTASTGISVYPEHAQDIDALISHADAAMYEAKQTGRNRVVLYTEKHAERFHALLQVEQKIKEAIEQNQFCMIYQPVVDMRTGNVVGAEALLRLHDASMMPDRFVPVAESAGLIWQLGDFVFGEACRQQERWKQQGLPTIPIAINVSALQFRRKDFSRVFESAIDDGRISADQIQIELTETTVMEDIDHSVAVLKHLRSKGYKVLLDDFGTGYSSLNYLSRLPLDKIKVDKSFIHRIHNDRVSRAVTEAIIALGRTLQLQIVAEGVESQDDLDYLRLHGCDQAQGYYVSRPASGDRFADWYRSAHAPMAGH
ncbi:EAL domain-containing protein [Oxalobacteraceae bacterium OM1]|nr:EAL domain-containing protein [Oxalobacteraceae bacterium OM1]